MSRQFRSWRSRMAASAGAIVVVGFVMFGSVGDQPGPLGTGQQKVTAQASLALPGTSFTLQARPETGRLTDQPVSFSPAEAAARSAAAEAHLERRAGWMAARANGLPASDPRVQAGPPPNAALQTMPRGPLDNRSAGPQAPGSATYFKTSQLVPPAGFGSDVNEPAVAQNGKDVIMTWNWFGAVSFDQATTWAYFNPAAFSGMTDFCCDQDVIYDKSRNRAIWERLGIGGFGCGAGCTQNRVLLTVLGDFNFLDFTYDLRGTTFGLTNAFLDYPRMALSDKFLYIQFNVFDWTTGNFVTHLLARLDLVNLSTGSVTGNFWTFAAGWSPTLVENAREVMYMGDQIVTNVGLNDQFRVYWIFDDVATLFAVDKTIAPYLFTNGNSVCIVPGGWNPCGRADQRIIGAVLLHNTPLPGNLGAAGDKIDFFWNVRAGNGFALPYVESAGFFGNTIAYVQRKFIFSNSLSWHYAAVGANDREHVGLSVMGFWPLASGINPFHYIGIDDDYNGNPPGWEVYNGFGGGAWTTNRAGDYLRARLFSPAGIGWVASGYSSVGSNGNYRPSYLAFGRERDIPGYNRFALQ